MRLFDKLVQRLRDHKQRKRIRNLPLHLRDAERFKARYPAHEYGFATYGLPRVHEYPSSPRLRIGKYSSIAAGVEIFLGGMHRAEWVTTYPFPPQMKICQEITDFHISNGEVVIGNDVWLCNGCVILSGVTIGHGAIVGARAVVAKDVPPYAVVVGNPARIIRYRFPEETCRQLLEIAWWDWPEEKVREAVPLLCSADMDSFLNYAKDITTHSERNQ